MKRKILYLVNPISGTGSKKPLRRLIEEKTTAAGLDFAIYPSVASGDYAFLRPIIRDEAFTDVVIAGGDGTINQAVNSLRKLPVRFGIIPCGSGNGLAFSARIPKNKEKALDLIFAGHSEPTDAFLINEVFACMLCGLGLDAQVAHDFADDPRRGLLTYVKKTITNFITAKAYPFVLTAGGKQIRTEAYFISIANSNQFGNHVTIAPKASLSDGLLDIVVMARQSKLALLLQALRQITGFSTVHEPGEVDENASLLYFQVSEIGIRNSCLAPLHIDGDPTETAKEFNIRVLKSAFRLIGPAR